MKSIYDYRCENLQSVRLKFKTISEMAEFIGTSKQSMGQLLNGNRKLGANLARKIEELLDLPRNQLDQPDASTPEEVDELSKEIARRIIKSNIPPRKILAMIDALLVEDE